MNTAKRLFLPTLIITFAMTSIAGAHDDDDSNDDYGHPALIFIDVSVGSPGVGKGGVAEFKLIHIPGEGESPLFEDGKNYFAYKKANDNMLALATWSVTHAQKLTVQLDPNAVGKKAIIYQMFLGGPLE